MAEAHLKEEEKAQSSKNLPTITGKHSITPSWSNAMHKFTWIYFPLKAALQNSGVKLVRELPKGYKKILTNSQVGTDFSLLVCKMVLFGNIIAEDLATFFELCSCKAHRGSLWPEWSMKTAGGLRSPLRDHIQYKPVRSLCKWNQDLLFKKILQCWF